MAKRPLILGIESSCDDTACALVDGDGRVLASVVSSQLKAHQPYGGVVPEIASREHLANWPSVSREVFERAGVDLPDVDVIAATRGPGLVGSLLVGLSLGRSMAFVLDRPFHGVHHLEGHVYSPYLAVEGAEATDVADRFLALVVSGGHTSLLRVDHGSDPRIHSLVETRDDAMGEVFDKVGKRLGLPYPQGPRVDKLAEQVDGPDGGWTPPKAYAFTIPKMTPDTGFFFSYSGLKSEALRQIEALERRGVVEPGTSMDETGPWPDEALELLAGFRHAAVGQILHRLERHHRQAPIEHLAVSGGAAANRLLRRRLQTWADTRGIDLRLVPLTYSGDNAAMIAFAALLAERRGESGDPRHAVVASRIPFAS